MSKQYDTDEFKNYAKKNGKKAKKNVSELDYVKLVEQFIDEDKIKQAGKALSLLVDLGGKAAAEGLQYAGGLLEKSAQRSLERKTVAKPRSIAPIKRKEVFDKRRFKDITSQQSDRFSLSTTALFIGPLVAFYMIDAGLVHYLAPLFIALCCAISSAFFYQKKKREQLMAQRINNYLSLIGDTSVVPIHELASGAMVSIDQVRQDIQMLVHEGVLRQARLVEEGKLLIIDNETYGLYKNYLRESAKQPSPYSSQKAFGEDLSSQEKAGTKVQSQLNQSVASVRDRAYRQELEANTQLPAEIKSFLSSHHEYLKAFEGYKSNFNNEGERKLNTIIEQMIHIEELLLRDVDKLAILKKYQDYLLPTLDKLLKKHGELCDLAQMSAKNREALGEIEACLDTLIEAFDKIIENMSFEDLQDIKSDISVLNAVLKQEGLLRKDFYIE